MPWWAERLSFPRRQGLASISLRMRQACVFHDYCYRHGAATYGYSQADCDYLLLEHAFRICRFINTEFTAERCLRDARKVLIGVRIGASQSFKHSDGIAPSISRERKIGCNLDAREPSKIDGTLVDDSCTSSYFEFNPYPIRSQSYTVYRIADAPAGPVDLLQKALYVLDIRPSGTRVSIIAWARTDNTAYCIQYDLPGSGKFLTTAPLVIRSAGKSGEDWLVWWRRFDLDQTGGHLAVVAPARANPTDWAKVFAGASADAVKGCSKLEGKPRADASNLPASQTILIGHNQAGDDADFSELHAAPGLEPSSGIRLMALLSHTCSKTLRDVQAPRNTSVERRRVTALCYHDFVLDIAEPRPKGIEGYVVRDRINRWHGRTSDGDLGDGLIPTAIATMSQRRSHSRGRRPKLRRSSRGCGEEKAAAKHMKPRPCYDARRESTTSALAFPLYALLGLKSGPIPSPFSGGARRNHACLPCEPFRTAAASWKCINGSCPMPRWCQRRPRASIARGEQRSKATLERLCTSSRRT